LSKETRANQPPENKAAKEAAKDKRRLPSASILISVVLHGLAALFLFLSPKFDSVSRAPKKRITEVELIDPAQLLKSLQKKPEPEGQIVEQDEKAINDEKPVDSKFLSRHDQTVVQQTQAEVHGRFRNTDGSSGAKTVERQAGKVAEKKGVESTKDQPIERKAEKEKEVLTADDGVGVKKHPTLKDLSPSFKPAPPPVDSDEVAQGGGDGPSTSDDHINDVKTGMQTLLSTREFVYYSYYNRIKDKLRQYWEPKIKEKMERIVRQGRNIASTSDRITKVVIILDGTGTLVRVQIVGPSGVNDLDDAAVEAFRAAAPFPNPPHGIADPDGTIKIRWDFILEARLDRWLSNSQLA
jgi:TonB family protein